MTKAMYSEIASRNASIHLSRLFEIADDLNWRRAMTIETMGAAIPAMSRRARRDNGDSQLVHSSDLGGCELELFSQPIMRRIRSDASRPHPFHRDRCIVERGLEHNHAVNFAHFFSRRFGMLATKSVRMMTDAALENDGTFTAMRPYCSRRCGASMTARSI